MNIGRCPQGMLIYLDLPNFMERFPQIDQENVRVKLPGRKELEGRLLAFSDDRTFVNNLYPHLLRHAGETVSLAELADIVLEAMKAYMNDVQSSRAGLNVLMLPYLAQSIAANPAAAKVLEARVLRETKLQNS
jgi:hypothetical protein